MTDIVGASIGSDLIPTLTDGNLLSGPDCDFTNLNAGCHESVPLEAQFAPRMPPSNEDARRREGDASSASS